ncbi:MAG: NUDIX hydrolase [Dehalococcoidia bacterium]|nr:NUDIX hydrolase [Dehalococcoidia bacterium]
MSLLPPSTPDARFCPRCGGPLSERDLPSEDRPRLFCDRCGYVFYRNPKLVAGAVPLIDGRIYLLRRGLEPRRGTWTFPAGYMELGESAEEAARRETMEETGLEVEIGSLLNVYSRPEVGVVVIVYCARVVGGEPVLGPETLELSMFSPQDIPWDDLSFLSTRWALADWVNRHCSASGARSAATSSG